MRTLLSLSLLISSVAPAFAQRLVLDAAPRIAAPEGITLSLEPLDRSLREAPAEQDLHLGAYFDSEKRKSSAVGADLSLGLPDPVAAISIPTLPSFPRSAGLRAAPEFIRPRSPLVTTLRLWLVAPLVALTLPLGRIEGLLRGWEMKESFPRSRSLGGGHSNVVLLAKGPNGEKRIVKRYGLAGTALARLSRFTLPIPIPMGISRRERFEDDRAAFGDFESAGIPASRMLSSDPATLTNVSSFVEGRPLMSLVKDDGALGESAKSLRMAHDRGWAIVDNQPSNFVIGKDGRAYFIDLEHSHRDPQGKLRAWDVGVYLAWLDAGLDEAEASKAEKAFWAGYGPVSAELAGRIAEIRASLRPFRHAMLVSFKDSEASSG